MTVGTWLKTWFHGEIVGLDEFGNRYYRSKGQKLNKRERRWVLYRGIPEASKIPAEWHAWLHHTVKSPLTEEAASAHKWQQTHVPNLTGTTNNVRKAIKVDESKDFSLSGDGYESWEPKK